jgi:hypothetical protein
MNAIFVCGLMRKRFNAYAAQEIKNRESAQYRNGFTGGASSFSTKCVKYDDTFNEGQDRHDQ